MRKDGFKQFASSTFGTDEPDAMKIRYLSLLRDQYRTIREASSEVSHLKAILKLPKGTEHFLSDLHGEHASFLHMLRNASGVIREKIHNLYDDVLPNHEQDILVSGMVIQATKSLFCATQAARSIPVCGVAVGLDCDGVAVGVTTSARVGVAVAASVEADVCCSDDGGIAVVSAVVIGESVTG